MTAVPPNAAAASADDPTDAPDPSKILTPEPASPEMSGDCETASLARLMETRPDPLGPFDAAWHIAYLDALAALLRTIGPSHNLAAPLGDVARQLASATTAIRSTRPPDPRELDYIYAFAAAEISYLVLTGLDEANAARRAARWLVTHNVPLPKDSGDPRGWVCLLKWRETLKLRKEPAAIYEQYRSRLQELKDARLR